MKAHKFDGKFAPRARQQAAFSQATQRRGAISYDQHGRPWDFTIELRSNAPTGPLHAKFHAPFIPDPKWIIVNPGNLAELYIDYPNWFRELRSDREGYHKRAVRLSVRRQWDAPKKGTYSEQVIEALGEPGQAFEPVVAAYQENPWIIGACKGCSGRDSNGEFVPRFSHNCVCTKGFTPYPPDPRLEKLLPRHDDAINEGVEDFSIDSYAKATQQTVEEVQQRPSQFRRVSRRAPIDGPESLDDGIRELESDSAAQTEALGGAAGSPEDEARFNAALDELETEPAADADGDLGDEVEDETEDRPATVPVGNEERALRQTPRREGQSTRRERGAHQAAKTARATTRAKQVKRSHRRRPNDNRPSLADGAAPVIGDE